MFDRIGNFIDSAVGVFSPRAGLMRAHARGVLAQYDAAKPSKSRKFERGGMSQNQLVEQSAEAIRNQARALERNHDISRGAIATLVNNIVGANGIGIEPTPRRRDGTIHEEYAKALRTAHANWKKNPEVSWQYSESQAQRLSARRWVVDGECFKQHIVGAVPGLDHGTRVPYSYELIPADLLSLTFNDESKGIRQSVERNAWGRPRAFHVLKSDPAESTLFAQNTKRISADFITQLATFDHIGQVRGMSMFASVVTRLADIKDYEESERVAAKVAAALTAFVRKGAPDDYGSSSTGGVEGSETGNSTARDLRLQPGTIIDNLGPGEEIGLINSSRPNPQVIHFRQGQLKAAAAGLNVSYSAFSKDYSGNYSAQRQEMVEQYANYAALTDEFVRDDVEPSWKYFVMAADISGVVPRPKDVDPAYMFDALYIAQQMPWIDPLKEMLAYKMGARAGFVPESKIIRKLGDNPDDVLHATAEFRKKARALELILDSDAAVTANAGTAQDYLRAREAGPSEAPEDSPPQPDTANEDAAARAELEGKVFALAERLESLEQEPAADNTEAVVALAAAVAALDAKEFPAPQITVHNHIPAPAVKGAVKRTLTEADDGTMSVIEEPIVNESVSPDPEVKP